jgi:uncharacterized protein YjbJ (UPF0337 family)
MGISDKFDNATDKIGGHAKEKTGEATGDDELKAEGKGDQTKGHLKDAAENVKDAFKN